MEAIKKTFQRCKAQKRVSIVPLCVDLQMHYEVAPIANTVSPSRRLS